MNKLLVFAGSIILFGCSVQPYAAFKAVLENTCGYPVHITVPGYDMFNSVDKILNPEESAIVMLNDCLDTHGFFTIQSSRYAINRLSSCIQVDYNMTIYANGKEQSVGDEKMLKILEKADYSHDGDRYYLWVIKDTSLCP
jgi:hypothetical protein